MISRTSICLIILFAVFGVSPADAQKTYRVFVKDASPARSTLSLKVLTGWYFKEIDVVNGFAELALDSGKHTLVMGTNEVSMMPKAVEIHVPEQDDDTLTITTRIATGLSTVPVLSVYYDTTTGVTSETSDFKYRIVNTDNPSVSYEPQGAPRALVVFDSLPPGLYEVVPLYDTTLYLHTKSTFTVAPNQRFPYATFSVRYRCTPKFAAYALTVENDEWRDFLQNEVVIALGVSIDDDVWQRDMGLTFPSSPATSDKVTVGSNGWMSLGWSFGEQQGLTKPLSSSVYAPVVVSVFGRDLNGRASTRVTESNTVRNGKRTYTVSWYNMGIYMGDLSESTVHLSGRAIIVEDGALGIEYGPITAQSLSVEAGIRGGDRTDVRSLRVSSDWLQPELTDLVTPCLLDGDFIPPPGTKFWFRPVNTTVEQERSAVADAVPCPARTIVRLKQACSNQQLSVGDVVLYTTAGATVSVPCVQDGEDAVLTISGLASGSYRTIIAGTSYVFIVER